jgi:hypothetical protein
MCDKNSELPKTSQDELNLSLSKNVQENEGKIVVSQYSDNDLKIPDENEQVRIMTRNGSLEYVQVDTSFSLRRNASPVPEDKLEDLFRSIALNNEDKMTDSDFERFLIELNRRYGREYNKEDAIEFFNALDVSNTGVLDLNEFKRAFSRIIMSLD